MFGLPEEVWATLLKIVFTAASGLFMYFLNKNIKALEKLSEVVSKFEKEFAVHKEHDAAVVKKVDKLEEDVSDIQKEQVKMKMDVAKIETLIKLDKTK